MSQVKETFEREGAIGVLTRAVTHVKRSPKNAFLLKGRNYQSVRIDTERRCELIEERLTPRDRTALDVGCNQGRITSMLADAGLFSIGIDRDELSLLAAKEENQFTPGVGFVHYDVTPDTVENLPSIDVVTLLAVFHHWVGEFGWTDAEEMLRTLGTASRILFFEVPKEAIEHPRFDRTETTSIVEMHERYLRHVFDDRVGVEYLDTVDYFGGEREDLVFLLHCDEFES